jgi:hypothetical protein
VNSFCSSCGQPVPQGAGFCGGCGTPIKDAAAHPPSVAPGGVRCKTCDVGVMQSDKQYRMSTPVVAIGYILLVPSILGILVALMMLITTASSTPGIKAPAKDAASKTLHQAGVPESIVQKVIASEQLSDAERARLIQNPTWTRPVEAAQLSIRASEVGVSAGTGIVGVFSILFGVASFVFGLLGWLLVMRKKVLQCNTCGAVVAAS